MEKNYFIFLFCLIFAISYSQHSDQDSNLKNLRKLESSEETILIGFDNYSYDLVDSGKNLNLTFNTYILLKNWNLSKIMDNDQIQLNNITIVSNISYLYDNISKYNEEFECSYDEMVYYKGNLVDKHQYCLVRYKCQFISNGTNIPKKINLVTDFLSNNSVNLNGTSISYESTSSQAVKRDITKLNYIFGDFGILENSTFVSKSLNSFKIKDGNIRRKNYNDFASNNIELITMINGYPKKIPCKGYIEQYNEDDLNYVFLETNGKYNLPNTDLKYTIVNYTKKNKTLILDFKEGENTAFIEKKNIPSRSNGLSTGGIIAIIIPTCLVLLGVTALAFFLSRKPTPPSPIKNIGNNTIGVASTEAIIHQ